MHEHRYDVLVVGAGPAGLAAAEAAAGVGRHVGVVDENPEPGGQIWRNDRGLAVHPDAQVLIRRAQERGTAFHRGTSLHALGGQQAVIAHDGAGALRFRADAIVLATGATELFLPFPGWTLPGVCGAGGLQALVKSGLDVRERRVVVAGSGPLLLAVAAKLRAAGADVRGVFEQAPRSRVVRFGMGLWRRPAKLGQALRLLRELRGIPRPCDSWPLRAEGRSGLERVVLRRGRSEITIEADLLACGFGLVPRTGPAALLGCRIRDGRVVTDHAQRTSIPGVLCAGESTGVGGLEMALVEGRIAGLVAAGCEGLARRLFAARRRELRFAARLDRAFALRDELRHLADPDTIVCRCEDVAWGAIARRAGPREAKLQTRCGMGPCQGRVCGAALEFLKGWPRDRVRPPLVPVTMRVLAESGAARMPAED